MNDFTGGFAPPQSAMQPQSPVMAPAQAGYQQQLAKALQQKGFASSQAADLSGVENMVKQMAMQSMMKPPAKTPNGAPIADAGITNQPMLSQFGSMLG